MSIDVLQVQDPAYIDDQMPRWLNWCKARGYERERFHWPAIARNRQAAALLALDLRGRSQAFLQVTDSHSFVCEQRSLSSMLYVPFVEVAPWNRTYAGTERVLAKVGLTCMYVAAKLSFERGLEGRVGLHATTWAQPFYERIGFVARYPGDCDSEYYEPYMEIDPAGALRLIEFGNH